ncbi:MAG: hypothetical protein J1E81_00705 [Eubacterium sp.]|nr:hypothetical protein [Eubacterium sp.]
MKEFFVYLYAALLGGFGYCTLEIIYRGRTHYSMFFAGAIVLSSFYYISKFTGLTFWQKCIIGALIITAIELILGIWFNIILNENVWDYSNTPFNFMGQICLPFSLIWLLISGAVFKIMEKVSLL